MMISYLPDLLHIGTKSVYGKIPQRSRVFQYFSMRHAAASVGLQQKVNMFWGQGAGPSPPDTAGSAGEWRWLSLLDTCTSSAAWQTLSPRTAPALQRGCPAQVCQSLAVICRWLEPLSLAAFPSLIGGLWNETKADKYWILWLMYKCFDCSITHHCCRSFWLRRSLGDQELLVSNSMFLFCPLNISKINLNIQNSLLTVPSLFYLRMLCWWADPS